MKLVTFYISGDLHKKHLGIVEKEDVIDLFESAIILKSDLPSAPFKDMLSWLDNWPESQKNTKILLDQIKKMPDDHPVKRSPCILNIKDIKIAAPLIPRTLRDFICFEKHMFQSTLSMAKMHYPFLSKLNTFIRKLTGRGFINVRRQWYKIPLYYKGNPHTVIGHGQDIIRPGYTQKLDYELEFAAVIGKRGKNINEKDARDYIAGFTIFNDISARDVQFDEIMGGLGPAKSKDFDTGNILGPFLVTTDEVYNPYNLEMKARVNGEEWSKGNSVAMHYTFEQLIAYISQNETISPGDVLGSGTVGNGCGLELGRYLQPGDRVELEIEKLGVLQNKVAD